MLDGWQAEGDGPRERILSFIQMLMATRRRSWPSAARSHALSELAKLDHVAQGRAAEILGCSANWLAGQFRELAQATR